MTWWICNYLTFRVYSGKNTGKIWKKVFLSCIIGFFFMFPYWILFIQGSSWFDWRLGLRKVKTLTSVFLVFFSSNSLHFLIYLFLHLRSYSTLLCQHYCYIVHLLPFSLSINVKWIQLTLEYIVWFWLFL